MAAKRQISIAFPQQLQVSDSVGALIEQFIGSILGGGITVAPAPAPVVPVAPSPPPEIVPIGSGAPLVQSIDAATGDERLQLAMRLGALLEGGNLTGPWNAGDNGKSFGPFQIYTVAHPQVSRQQAEDPTFAVGFMLPAYQAAVNNVDFKLWDSDPKLAAAQTVFLAERPANFYPQSRIDWAWPQVTTEALLPPRTVGR